MKKDIPFIFDFDLQSQIFVGQILKTCVMVGNGQIQAQTDCKKKQKPNAEQILQDCIEKGIQNLPNVFCYNLLRYLMKPNITPKQ